jgi:hypothetical protein
MASQVPTGKIEGTPLPLNDTKVADDDADPVVVLVSPPVRFAPLGYKT